MITKKVTAMIIYPLDSKGLKPALDKAAAAGIKVITMNYSIRRDAAQRHGLVRANPSVLALYGLAPGKMGIEIFHLFRSKMLIIFDLLSTLKAPHHRPLPAQHVQRDRFPLDLIHPLRLQNMGLG